MKTRSTLIHRGRLEPSRPVRGIVLPTVLILGLLMLAMVGGLVSVSTQQTRTRARYQVFKDEFNAAEYGLNKAYAQIQYMVANHTANLKTRLESMPAPTLRSYTFPQFTIRETFAGNEAITDGRFTGMTLYRLRYQIDTRAHQTGNTSARFAHAGAALRQNLEITYIPLYLYAIFYDPLMEVAPSPFMQVNGLVHANNDAYFQSNNGLDFMKNVTVASHVYHGRAPGYGPPDNATGEVQFTRDATLMSMKRSDADGWLTSLDADWSAAAQTRWDRGLRDQAQGAKPLNLPIPTSVDAYSIIERAGADDGQALRTEKFEYKAGLKIVVANNGTVTGTNSAGGVVDLTYPNPANPSQRKSIYSATTFYDAREAKTVSTIDLNVANMLEGQIYPANGIVYVANEVGGSRPGVVRLINGATLPHGTTASGLTVATKNPLYIKGDYNTINPAMGMVVSDALSILSNAWNDANSANYSSRTASNTTVNAVCISGIVPSANNRYSGGVENFFRYLENWSGKRHTFNGSIITMWSSRLAVGLWGSGSVYSPPNRYWAWDTTLGGLNGPPGAPYVIELERSTWELQTS